MVMDVFWRSQCCVLHDMQFVNATRGCNRRSYRGGILQSRSHNCFIGSHECLLLFPHPIAVSAFMICRGLCACTEMVWMCVMYVSFGSKTRPKTFGCIAMGSALLFNVRSRLLVYSAGSVCRYRCMYVLAALVLVCVDVIVMSSA